MLFGGNLAAQVLFAARARRVTACLRRIVTAAADHGDQLAGIGARRNGPDPGRYGRGRGRHDRRTHRGGHPAGTGCRSNVYAPLVHRVLASRMGLVRAPVVAAQ